MIPGGPMDFIGWTDDYSVGIKTFDDEHKQLISYINKLHIGMKSGEGISSMGYLLDGLIDYTIMHFGHEEEFMVKYSYAEYNRHKAEHDNFTEKINRFNRDFAEGKKFFSLELMAFLRDWLINHILGTDMKYKIFFRGKIAG
jgi:hemerythrin